jgi:DNA-binding IclR family transcriptional regulator
VVAAIALVGSVSQIKRIGKTQLNEWLNAAAAKVTKRLAYAEQY